MSCTQASFDSTCPLSLHANSTNCTSACTDATTGRSDAASKLSQQKPVGEAHLKVVVVEWASDNLEGTALAQAYALHMYTLPGPDGKEVSIQYIYDQGNEFAWIEKADGAGRSPVRIIDRGDFESRYVDEIQNGGVRSMRTVRKVLTDIWSELPTDGASKSLPPWVGAFHKKQIELRLAEAKPWEEEVQAGIDDQTGGAHMA